MTRKRQTHADIRRAAIEEALVDVRADILLEPELTVPQLLERITRSLTRLMDKK